MASLREGSQCKGRQRGPLGAGGVQSRKKRLEKVEEEAQPEEGAAAPDSQGETHDDGTAGGPQSPSLLPPQAGEAGSGEEEND